LVCGCGTGDTTGGVGAWGMAAGCKSGAAGCRRLAPQLLQNDVPIDGAPHLLQNLAAGAPADAETAGAADDGPAGGAGGAAGGGGLPASRVSYPHFTQKIPLTGAPHLLQKLAMLSSADPDHSGIVYYGPMPVGLRMCSKFEAESMKLLFKPALTAKWLSGNGLCDVLNCSPGDLPDVIWPRSQRLPGGSGNRSRVRLQRACPGGG
jgi:hypothetical protein